VLDVPEVPVVIAAHTPSLVATTFGAPKFAAHRFGWLEARRLASANGLDIPIDADDGSGQHQQHGDGEHDRHKSAVVR
jgi:hypothetical protein